MYKNFVFDVYGTLVDIHTNEHEEKTWEKMVQTLEFYGAKYTATELKEAYFSSCELQMIQGKANFKHPEVDVVEVFRHIFENKRTQKKSDGRMIINLKISCKDVDHYHSIVSRLRGLRDVIGIERGYS